MSNLRFHSHALIFFTSLVAICFVSVVSATIPNNNALFVFGDSVFDPGNNNFLNVTVDFRADFWPYGETFFHFPTGRFCDGRIEPDFLTMYLGIPLFRPYLEPGKHDLRYGANFASAGAVAIGSGYEGTLSLSDQLSYFKEYVTLLQEQVGDEEAEQLLSEAVYLSSIGGIDYLTFAPINPNATEAETLAYVDLVLGNISDVVKEIYDLGGRKFAFQNVGPIGCLPVVRQLFGLSNGSCYEDLLAIVSLHNEALYNFTAELQSELSGFNYLVFDYYSLVLERVENPQDYGFSVSVNACCGNGTYRGQDCGILNSYYLCSDPNEYLWFDGGHVTEHAYSQLAELMWEGGLNTTTPYNMKQLYELDLNLTNHKQTTSSGSGSWSII